MSPLGKRITESLNEMGARPADLARAVRCSRSTVSDWISGKTKELAGSNLVAAAAYLQVSSDWLSTGKGSKDRLAIGDDVVLESVAEYKITTSLDRKIARELNDLDEKDKRTVLTLLKSMNN